MIEEAALRPNKFIRNIAGRKRLISCLISGFAAWYAFKSLNAPSPVLSGWNIAVLLYLGLTARMMMKATPDSIRHRAMLIDESRFAVLALAIVTVAASYGSIIAEVREVKLLTGPIRLVHLGLAGLTIATGWFLIHTIFAQHYAHEYFIERASEKALPEADRGGLAFPGGVKPDYSDFLYFAFVIGVASQTADVSITSRPMRRLSLIHCIISFFFNATVLALTINIAASFLSG